MYNIQKNLTEVRCPKTRPHEIKGIQYQSCGHLLGAIDTTDSSSVIFRCDVCGVFVVVSTESGIMEVTTIPKGTQLKLNKQWRVVNGED